MIFRNRTGDNMGFSNRTATPRASASQAIFAGARLGDVRPEVIPAGEHVVEIVSCEETNETHHHHAYLVTTKIIESDTAKAGDLYVVIHMLIPPWYTGLKELKALAVAAGGFGPTAEQRAKLPLAELREQISTGEAEFDALDASCGAGSILAASAGAQIDGAPSIVGCKAHVRVSLGKPVLDRKTKEPTGDHYRVCVWSVSNG
jgi:hypothetical protein